MRCDDVCVFFEIFRHLIGFVLFLGLCLANLMEEVPQVADLFGFFSRFVLCLKLLLIPFVVRNGDFNLGKFSPELLSLF